MVGPTQNSPNKRTKNEIKTRSLIDFVENQKRGACSWRRRNEITIRDSLCSERIALRKLISPFGFRVETTTGRPPSTIITSRTRIISPKTMGKNDKMVNYLK